MRLTNTQKYRLIQLVCSVFDDFVKDTDFGRRHNSHYPGGLSAFFKIELRDGNYSKSANLLELITFAKSLLKNLFNYAGIKSHQIYHSECTYALSRIDEVEQVMIDIIADDNATPQISPPSELQLIEAKLDEVLMVINKLIIKVNQQENNVTQSTSTTESADHSERESKGSKFEFFVSK